MCIYNKYNSSFLTRTFSAKQILKYMMYDKMYGIENGYNINKRYKSIMLLDAYEILLLGYYFIYHTINFSNVLIDYGIENF